MIDETNVFNVGTINEKMYFSKLITIEARIKVGTKACLGSNPAEWLSKSSLLDGVNSFCTIPSK